MRSETPARAAILAAIVMGAAGLLWRATRGDDAMVRSPPSGAPASSSLPPSTEDTGGSGLAASSSPPSPSPPSSSPPSSPPSPSPPTAPPSSLPSPSPPTAPGSSAREAAPSSGAALAEATAAEVPAEAPPRFTASADGIREAMGYAAHDLRECYDGWLQTAPQLAGTVKVRFAITPAADGTATLTDIALADSSLAHSWMEGCIIAAVRDLSFEAPADGKPLHVTYPLAFAAKKD